MQTTAPFLQASALSCFMSSDVACADAVFAVAWNPAQPDMAASGGGDDKAYIWKVLGFALGMHSSMSFLSRI